MEEVIRESNKLLVQWEYTPPPEPTPPSPAIAYQPPTQKRRFVAVDSLKPKLLGMDTSFEDFIDFCKRFTIYTKACYEGVPVVDGLTAITYEEWSTILLTCVEPGWSKRITYDQYRSIRALLDRFDEEIQLLQTLHLRRISLIKIRRKSQYIDEETH